MTTKKFLLLLLMLGLFSTEVILAQAKKPSIMVVPSDAWCKENGYMLSFDNQGISTEIPDYKKALQGNTDLLLVISKINGLMAEREFPLINLETEMKNLNSYAAEDAVRSSKESGAGIAESPIDQLKSVANADIIMQLTWTINQTGPKKSISFNLQGLDSYTGKQVATAVGTGAPSFSTELPVLLEEAVLSYIDNFSNSLQNHFDDMFENGREVSIRIQRWDNWESDLETEFGPNGDELGLIIEDWLADNTVQGRFSTSMATENRIVFDQVRIPLYTERNGRQRAINTRDFTRELVKFLENSPYNINSKLTMRGLGEATIILGSK